MTLDPLPGPSEVEANKIRYDAEQRRLDKLHATGWNLFWMFWPMAFVSGVQLYRGGRAEQGRNLMLACAAWFIVALVAVILLFG